MVNYLEILSDLMNQPHYLLLILILLYLVSGTLDFVVGSFNAICSNNVVFSSKTAQLGIVRKLVTLAVMVLIVPLALMLSMDVAIYLLTVLYVGIVGSEIYSILAHVGIVKESDKDKNFVGLLFKRLLDSVYKDKGMKG